MDLLKDSICPISYEEFVLKYNVRLSNFTFYLFYDLKFGKCIRNISFFIKKENPKRSSTIDDFFNWVQVFLRIYKLEEVQHIWNTNLFKTNNNYGGGYK